MPLFIKKEDEEQQEQFINELKTEQQPETGQTKQTSTPEQTFQPRIQLQATQTKKQDQLPKGTFAVSVISANFEFARFTSNPKSIQKPLK
jgi:hypothetical protein